MKFFIPLVFFLLTSLHATLCAQDFAAGARTRALGTGCAADTAAWSLFNNPAGIAHTTQTAVLITDERLYGLQEITSFSAGLIYPVKSSLKLGITFHKQGYRWFNDQQIGLHAAHAKGPYSLGISFILWQRTAGETFRETYPMFNIGGTMSVNKHLQLGLHISNAGNTQNTVQNIPLQIKAGLLYKVSHEVLIYVDVVKHSNRNLFACSGMEYRIHKNFYLRTGIQLKPLRPNGGIGFSNRRISVDYSFSSQQPLGSRHQVSMHINFQKK